MDGNEEINRFLARQELRYATSTDKGRKIKEETVIGRIRVNQMREFCDEAEGIADEFIDFKKHSRAWWDRMTDGGKSDVIRFAIYPYDGAKRWEFFEELHRKYPLVNLDFFEEHLEKLFSQRLRGRIEKDDMSEKPEIITMFVSVAVTIVFLSVIIPLWALGII